MMSKQHTAWLDPVWHKPQPIKWGVQHRLSGQIPQKLYQHTAPISTYRTPEAVWVWELGMSLCWMHQELLSWGWRWKHHLVWSWTTASSWCSQPPFQLGGRPTTICFVVDTDNTHIRTYYKKKKRTTVLSWLLLGSPPRSLCCRLYFPFVCPSIFH